MKCLSVQLLCSELWVKMALSPKTSYQHWETQNHNINSLAIKKTAIWFVDLSHGLLPAQKKSSMSWLQDLSCSSEPQELDHKFRSCSDENPHHPPLTLICPLHLPPSVAWQGFVVARQADFRSSRFLAEGGLFSKQSDESRRFTRAPVTTRWFVFTHPLICLDSLLSEGLVS